MIIPTWGLIYAGLRGKETGFSPGKKFPGTRAMVCVSQTIFVVREAPEKARKSRQIMYYYHLIEYINHSLIYRHL
jgi:hypothetical protein